VTPRQIEVTFIKEKLRIDALKDTTRLRYQVRLDPNEFPGSNWRDCNSKTYFDALRKGLYGGLVQARTLNEKGQVI
jgi:hypothetical protein